VEHLRAVSGVTVDRLSSVYLTEPRELKNQPWFANQVAALRCSIAVSPHDLLDALSEIEDRMGRSRAEDDAGATRFGPRIIDLDVLLYGSLEYADERLQLPHPRIKERAFVLVPLVEIAPEAVLPDGERVATALKRIDYTLDGRHIYQA
jgi:2-amino-4-hydroxy-6-hydroxymethyldihydropteridine diphosphokinase